jgi:streptomycin 6-kinase
MDLNPTFLFNIQKIYGPSGVDWLNSIPTHLKTLSKIYDFEFIKPMSELSYTFVGLIKLKSRDTIIKMAPPTYDLLSEVKWLRSFKTCVPEVFVWDESLNAYLMESIRPGISLKSLVRAGDDDKATHIICEVIRELQSQNPTESSFKHLSDLAKDLTILKGHLEAKFLNKAESLFHELTQDRTRDRLLHGDLHHDNILASGTEWKIIDPHGYIGEPEAEIGAMIRNPYDCFPTGRSLKDVFRRRYEILSAELLFDAQKIRAWGYCVTVLSIAWTLEGYGRVNDSDKEEASTLYSLL